MAFNFNDYMVNIEVDIDNLGKGIRQMEAVDSAIQRGIELGLDEVVEKTKVKIVEYLGIYGLADTSLASSIVINPTIEGMEIFVGADYAMYVEFGTGIVGEGSPHPHPWAYDINGHGEKGWVYQDDNGDWHRTRGQSSHPFMYQTWLWASRSAVNIINKNIRREVRKVSGVR